jgi:hypothetical protein
MVYVLSTVVSTTALTHLMLRSKYVPLQIWILEYSYKLSVLDMAKWVQS